MKLKISKKNESLGSLGKIKSLLSIIDSFSKTHVSPLIEKITSQCCDSETAANEKNVRVRPCSVLRAKHSKTQRWFRLSLTCTWKPKDGAGFIGPGEGDVIFSESDDTKLVGNGRSEICRDEEMERRVLRSSGELGELL